MAHTVTDAPRAGETEVALTDDAFLGGTLKILQPRTGYRAGLDAVMLAAAVPTAPGSVGVLDVGAGVGTAGLCVARRLPAAEVVLFEREPKLAAVAIENIGRNGLAERVRVVAGEVGISAAGLKVLGLTEESFTCVIANPPYHRADEGTAASDTGKAASHAMPEEDLDRWARFLARMTAPGGSVTLVYKAEALIRVLAALDSRFGALKLLPLAPRAGAPAHRIIVQGTKGSRAPPVLLAPVALHAADGAFTPEVQAILRSGSPLPMAPV